MRKQLGLFIVTIGLILTLILPNAHAGVEELVNQQYLTFRITKDDNVEIRMKIIYYNPTNHTISSKVTVDLTWPFHEANTEYAKITNGEWGDWIKVPEGGGEINVDFTVEPGRTVGIYLKTMNNSLIRKRNNTYEFYFGIEAIGEINEIELRIPNRINNILYYEFLTEPDYSVMPNRVLEIGNYYILSWGSTSSYPHDFWGNLTTNEIRVHYNYNLDFTPLNYFNCRWYCRSSSRKRYRSFNKEI